MERIEKTSCGRMDHGGCGLLVEVRGDKIVRIKGDPDSLTKGYVCAKGRAHLERLYHAERIKYPLARTGKRGENRWKRISWDEAFQTIIEKLSSLKSRSAAERALFMQGTPKGLENLLLYRFAHSFGSPNVAATGTVCFAPRLGASIFTNGYYPHPDLEYPPKLILVWGGNHLSTSADGVLAPVFRQAMSKGSRLIVIDPVKREMVRKSDLWLRIKPGRDGLLALGMIKVIIEEGLYDREFVSEWTLGFEELRTHVRSFSLSDIEKETWVSVEEMEKAARSYARAESAAILWGNAIDHTINSVQTARALLILMALSGNLDRPGGNIQPGMPKVVAPRDFMLINKHKAVQNKMIGRDFKLASMLGFVPYHLAVRAILYEDPYKIEFCYIQGTNPLVSCPNSQESFNAFEKIDFLVVAELFMTPTAQFADIVLPAANHFEFDDLAYYGQPFGKIFVRPKIIDPPGECLSDVKILNELAVRLNLEDPFWKDEEECINYILGPSGLTFSDLKKKGVIGGENTYEKFTAKGFPTQSGKVELFSSWMEKNGYAPLPVFSELGDDSDRDMNLIFTSAKMPEFFHSMNRNLPSLRKRHPEPTIVLHPDTAKDTGLGAGDWAWVENEQGRAKFNVKLNERLDPRVVMGEHAWWFPERGAADLYGWSESNINMLTKNTAPYEPSIGTINLRGIPCRVYKA